MDNCTISRTNRPDERYRKRKASKAAKQRQLNKAKKQFLTTLTKNGFTHSH
jgi:hypothetical protein